MATSARFRSSALVVLLLCAACSKKDDPGPPCDRVVDHMLDVTKQTLLGHESMTADLKRQMIAQCQQRNYSKDVRECLLAAKDPAELAACSRGNRPATPPPSPANPPLPRPTTAADGGIPAP